MLDALHRDGKWILYQDAGQEFRRTIEEVEELISKDGYFYVAQDGWETKLMCCGRIGELTVDSMQSFTTNSNIPGLYSQLGVSKGDYENKTMCAGYYRHSISVISMKEEFKDIYLEVMR